MYNILVCGDPFPLLLFKFYSLCKHIDFVLQAKRSGNAQLCYCEQKQNPVACGWFSLLEE